MGPDRDRGPQPHVELVSADWDAEPGAGGGEAELRDWVRGLPGPEAGLHTSRSYSFPYGLVGWHDGPVGVDIERIVACDERFARSICTPEEAAREPWQDHREIISLWSGKEALAKALGDALAYDPRRLESPASWINGAAGPWRARRLRVPAGFCGWVCWRAEPGF